MSSTESQGRERHVAPAPHPADVGIVAALPAEIKPFLARLRDLRRYVTGRFTIQEGTLDDRLVAVVVTGPGVDAASQGARRLVAGHRPRWLVSPGFAGGLDPSLQRNDLVLPDTLIDYYSGRIRVPFESAASPATPRRGTLVTVSRIILTADEKQALHAATSASCVDMESFAVASLAADLSIRFLSLRIISDPATETLPAEILSLVGPTGGYRIGAAVGAILKRPTALAELLQLRDHANQAAQRLAVALAEIIPRLTPASGSA